MSEVTDNDAEEGEGERRESEPRAGEPQEEGPTEGGAEAWKVGEFREFLDRAKSGDRSAWEAIFEKLGDETEEEGAAVLALARRALPRDHWARDLVESRDVLQSALRVGWLHAEEFRGSTEGEFFAWLRTILRNKVERAGRRQEHRLRKLAGSLEDMTGGAEGAEAESPIESALEEEIRGRVREAIRELPEDQRQVMDLYLAGLKSPEIAQLLGISPAAVRKRESRAVAHLREILGE
jgi:RNA polymerase sigma factor (sigma-70 family)